jgi:hypothetical protein
VSDVDQHAEAHRLKSELGYGARRIGDRLGISRHAATLLLSQPLAEQIAEVAEPVAEVAATDGQERRPVAELRLPRRVAEPLAGVDLGQWPAARRDLAVLVQTGRSAEAMAHQAITALAHHYRRALARGELQPGQPFLISDVTLRPTTQLGDRPAPSALAEGG